MLLGDWLTDIGKKGFIPRRENRGLRLPTCQRTSFVQEGLTERLGLFRIGEKDPTDYPGLTNGGI
jgi:hypothetical protein